LGNDAEPGDSDAAAHGQDAFEGRRSGGGDSDGARLDGAIGAHAAGDQIESNAGTWKTWVISSGREFRVAAPLNDAATAAAEIGDLKSLAKKRDAAAKDLIAQMHADAREIMPPVMLDCVMTMKQPFITPIYDFTAPKIVFGRVAMVGDAAANARPHMGFGVAKAGGDAEALARALGHHDDIDTALKAYNAERQPIGNTIVMHSRKLGTHMGVDLKTEEDRRMHELLQNAGAMMDWIAVPNFLDAYK
jgi:2-polyprenyl-6-methoxyphenol hydroxylase-like FAD-dependent oxidoreductase